MATVNKVYSISRAKGRGDYRLVHVTFDDWGSATGVYNTGGIAVVVPDAKEVISPLNVDVQSGGIVLKTTSYSGAAIKILGYNASGAGNLTELLSGTATSGVFKVDVAAIVEQT